MSPIISKPLDFLKRLFFLTFPMFSSAEAARAGDPAVRWLARILLVGIVLAILAAINQAALFGLSNVIHATAPWIGRFWLPLLALCLYVMLWLGWWLYRLLNLDIEPVGSEFPDIDRAWGQAVEAMGRSDIALDNAPLFLVLGWPSGSEDDFFRSAGIKGPVRQVPGEPEAPLHVTANRDGIWLTCPGASLLGQYHHEGAGTRALEEVMSTMSDEAADEFKTMGMGAGAAATLRVEDFQATFKDAQERSQGGRNQRVENPEDHLARLRHLCRLIIRDRRGFCPINGVLLTLPIGIDIRGDLADLADACRQDMATMFDTFRMRCPVLALVCGLEQVKGFSELIERLPRAGAQADGPAIPPGAGSDRWRGPGEGPGRYRGDLCQPVSLDDSYDVPGGVQRVRGRRWGASPNSQLFRFLQGIEERGDRMARLVKDCLPSLRGEPVMFGGCYFAATGRDPATEQAFASGVLMRLIKEDQDSVTWTADALDQDATAARLVGRVRMAFLVIITLGILAAAGLIAQRFLATPVDSNAASSKGT